jgi:perosamine synthetase
MIPVARPSTGDEEMLRIKKVLDSGWLGQGNEVKEFESRIGKITGAREVVALNSGTSALTIALEVTGIKSGDEVIVPSLTFCAGVQAIKAVGGNPVYCEVDSNTLNIDIDDVAKRITDRTKAIMPVHFCGQACDMDALFELATKNDLLIIEDAAHAFGSSYKGEMIGSFEKSITCFSFDPIKNITCGEGGAVATGSKDIANRLRNMRMLGIDRDSWHRRENPSDWYYEVTAKGYRMHMSNINAAIGLAQIEKFELFRERKRAVVEKYNSAFENNPGLITIKWNIAESFPFAYIVRVKANLRDQLMLHLRQQGIDSGINYIPNHLQPFLSGGESLPVTEKLYGEIITLPLFADISDSEVEQVISSVLSFFK